MLVGELFLPQSKKDKQMLNLRSFKVAADFLKSEKVLFSQPPYSN